MTLPNIKKEKEFRQALRGCDDFDWDDDYDPFTDV